MTSKLTGVSISIYTDRNVTKLYWTPEGHVKGMFYLLLERISKNMKVLNAL
jgi:hypothetical protein